MHIYIKKNWCDSISLSEISGKEEMNKIKSSGNQYEK